ncbi:SDR family NAD(P)-dependent oxidoreductase [Novosphingobium rosa]|uniref:SDR family NAD(P)-dependent oxidoreductase n=1 Tax=Novosphingobium rosa TaxID=76978 RepID=UPI00082B2782|nr:SDR family oxidoreductase [Novosphingobium rosa]
MQMTVDLSGKQALVTGASSGLGAHFARLLARSGAQVLLAARREEALAQVAAQIEEEGGSCRTLRLDVSDPTSVRDMAPMIAGLDILINNAGVVRESSALDHAEADWDAVIDTNLKGSFLLAQAAARAMQAHGRGGSIVNIASILGLRQGGGVVSYAVSKAGVIQLTRTLALEWARYGVRVNALAPGYIATDLNEEFWDSDPGKAMIRRIPQRRLGRLEDLDGPLLLLASDASAYMTGSVIAADGGHLVSGL